MAKKVKLGLNQAWTRLILAWEILTGITGFRIIMSIPVRLAALL